MYYQLNLTNIGLFGHHKNVEQAGCKLNALEDKINDYIKDKPFDILLINKIANQGDQTFIQDLQTFIQDRRKLYYNLLNASSNTNVEDFSKYLKYNLIATSVCAIFFSFSVISAVTYLRNKDSLMLMIIPILNIALSIFLLFVWESMIFKRYNVGYNQAHATSGSFFIKNTKLLNLDDCAICFSEINKDHKLSGHLAMGKIPHIFHYACLAHIKNITKVSYTCPMCIYEIRGPFELKLKSNVPVLDSEV